MKARRPGRKPAQRRPQTGRHSVMPRSSSTRGTRPTPGEARPRGGRVNQKMINGMIKMRTEGFTHAQIARHYGVSERTVRRHTKGVSPRLVHATDPKHVDLLTWCSASIFASKDRLELSVRETDIALKKAREEV